MTETNAAIRTELFKFADAFQQAARELELHCNGLEHRREPADEIIPYDSLLESTGTA